jgi:hypothetical protein
MHETDADIEQLQELLDRSARDAGAHVRSVFGEDERIDARELVTELAGIVEMHLAAVTAAGAPLVAPTDGIFWRGRVWFGLPARAVRARLVRRDPRVSASYTRDSFAFIVHGRAQEVDESDPAWPEYEALLRELYVAAYGTGWIEWYEELRRQPRGSSFSGYIEPRVMFAKR